MALQLLWGQRGLALGKGLFIPSQSPQSRSPVERVFLFCFSMQLRLLQLIKEKASFLEGRGLSQPKGESPPRSWVAEVVLK